MGTGKFVYTEWHGALGRKLRALRLQRKLTLQKVSASVGIQWQMLQRFELATGRIPADTFTKLVTFYGVDARWLLGLLAQPSDDSTDGPLARRTSATATPDPSL